MSIINSFPNGGGDKMEVDSALSGTSENPVQNKVIKTELDKAYKTDDTAETALADADYIPFYDASAGGKRKTLWSNVKDVLANTFQKKLTAGELISIDSSNKISSTVPTFANAFSRGDIIDTTERIVGMFMGKPMYQKALKVDSLPNSGSVYVSHGISNFEKLINGWGYAKNSSWEGILPYGGTNGIGIGINYSQSDKIQIQVSADYSSITECYVTIRYTKTTDTANTIKYGTGNDYSLDEQIVGTWIDGKRVYQKTIDCGALSNVSSMAYKLVDIGASIETGISATGITSWGTGWLPIPFNNNSSYITLQIDDNTNIDNRNKIEIHYVGNYSWVTHLYVTVQYTKTTDA